MNNTPYQAGFDTTNSKVAKVGVTIWKIKSLIVNIDAVLYNN